MDNRPSGVNVLISMVGLLAIVCLVNHLAFRHYARLDWTKTRLFSLSDKSVAVVDSIDREVTAYVLWSKSDPLFPALQEMIRGYESLSSHLTFSFVDQDKNPEQFKMVRSRYGKTLVSERGQIGMEAGIVFVSGDNVKFIGEHDFHQVNNDDLAQQPTISFHAEGQITSALMAVTRDDKQRVCFTEGHDEWQLEKSKKRSFHHVKRDLELDGFQVRAINLITHQTELETCDIVVVAGPMRSFLADERQALARRFATGGNLLLLLDPIIDGNRFIPTGLEALTAKAGIVLNQDLVLETDPRRLVFDTHAAMLVDRFFTHDAVKPLTRNGTAAPVLVSLVRSLRQVEADNAISDILAATSPVSFGETDVASVFDGSRVPQEDEGDTPGPAVIAMSAVADGDGPNDPGKMIVIGDSDFMSEELFVSAGHFNKDLWSSAIGWLAARRELVSIAPKNPEQVQLMLTQREYALLVVSVLMVFLGVVVYGIFVIVRRKK